MSVISGLLKHEEIFNSHVSLLIVRPVIVIKPGWFVQPSLYACLHKKDKNSKNSYSHRIKIKHVFL